MKSFNKLIIYFLLFIPLLIFISYTHFNEDIKVIYPIDYINPHSDNHLVVHYIDVGQGDCELIQIGNINMLIDSGPNAYEDKVIEYLKSQGVKTLDYVIATHPHEDHIGNMDEIIKIFHVNTFLSPKVSSNTDDFISMINALKKKKLKITIAKAGTTFNLTSDVACQFVAPTSSYYEEMNNYSAILKLKFNQTSFLFTGDAEELSEMEVLQNNYDISSNVLKVGHHGSRTSSTKEFLKAINPKLSIISCGKNNIYKHPNRETLNTLNHSGSKIYRTDYNHNIVIVSDGYTISVIDN